MKKSARPITADSVWLTELNDTEMESTTGGLLTNNQLTGWLNDYKAGNLHLVSMLSTLQKEIASKDTGADLKVFQKWFFRLSREDKKLVVSSMSDFVKGYLKA